MSISTTNPFDLLDENGGRPRKVKQVAPKPVVAKPVVEPPKVQQPAQPKAAPAKATPAANTAAPAKKENDAKPRPQGDAPRGNRNAGKDGAVKKAPAQQQPRQQQQQAAPARGPEDALAEKPRERRDRDHRTHDRPTHRGRQFDRRSGTGRPANENKRHGSGKGNWGTIEEGQEGANGEVTKELAEGEKEEAVAAEGEVAASPETETAPAKEPEKELLSLDEYYATLKNKVVTSVEAPKIRQAGEGVDQAAWANYAPLTKEESSTAPLKKKKESKKDAANGKDEKTIPIQIKMTPHESFGEGRRGRGGPRGGRPDGSRGGRGRGGPRFARGGYTNSSSNTTPANNTKDVAIDMSQFPTLGGAPAQAAAPAPVKA